MMKNYQRVAALALVAVIATGCADLEVTNPNDADRERALRTAGDVEALIAGSYGTWYEVTGSNTSPPAILMTMAYQHSATAANFGMVEFSGWPKVPAHTFTSDNFSTQNNANAWIRLWRAASTSVEGLVTLDQGNFDLAAEDLARAQAYGFFNLGLVHASAAVMFDQGYIYDPSIPIDEVVLHPAADVFEAAVGYFDQAVQIAGEQAFTIPATWMSRDVSNAELVRLAHSYRARFRAAMARTPAERQQVNWSAVIADLDAGMTTPWLIDTAPGRFEGGAQISISTNIFRLGAWGQMSYQVAGMADQSGMYQTWFDLPFDDRTPNIDGEPFLIITDDLRFPQGSTIAEQQANRGTNFMIQGGTRFSNQWVRPDRGTFRWSYYRFHALDDWSLNDTPRPRGDFPEITMAEMRLLRAEALYRGGQEGAAANIVNETRVAAGLNATNANGLNTSCVPRLPNGECGDLFEMLKWEVRMETMDAGLFMAPWYFHGRGWGDLTEGSFLELPVPCQELELQFEQCYTFGATFPSSAPAGTYGN